MTDGRDYLVAVEREFTRHRGGDPFLTPADWELAHGWEVKGVPLEAALAGIRTALAARLRPSPRTPLRHCAPAVEREFRAAKARVAGTAATFGDAPPSGATGPTSGPTSGPAPASEESASGPGDAVHELVARLAAFRAPEALGADPETASRLEAAAKTAAARLEALAAEPGTDKAPDLEAAWSDLLDDMTKALPPSVLDACRRQAAEALEDHRSRMPDTTYRHSFRQAVRRRAARKLGLPPFVSAG